MELIQVVCRLCPVCVPVFGLRYSKFSHLLAILLANNKKKSNIKLGQPCFVVKFIALYSSCIKTAACLQKGDPTPWLDDENTGECVQVQAVCPVK